MSTESSRPEVTPPEIEKLEMEWWQKFAGLEQRFTWVQTPEMQRILRGKYIREIIRATPPGGRILELGCGTGWLCLELARVGAREVWGIDFSPAQIELARTRAAAEGLGDRVRFVCADGSQGSPAGEPFDCVVVHAFLHHLNRAEIRRTLAGIPAMLRPEGVFIVFEPVYDPALRRPPMGWERWQRSLAAAGRRGRPGPEEARWRALFAEREAGIPPHGPSPKEIPFVPGEMEEYLGADFAVRHRRDCMAVSHLVVQEWLLRGLSRPFTSRLLLPWIAKTAAYMDSRLLRNPNLPATSWKFVMYVCSPRPGVSPAASQTPLAPPR